MDSEHACDGFGMRAMTDWPKSRSAGMRLDRLTKIIDRDFAKIDASSEEYAEKQVQGELSFLRSILVIPANGFDPCSFSR